MSVAATIDHPAQAAAADAMPVIDAHRLYRFYHAGDEEVLALRGVSLQVFRAEMVAVVGPSGSGKSTLLACLAGLDDPDGGRVSVVGRRMSRVGERHRAKLRAEVLGVLLQSGNLVGHLSVADNVMLARRLAGRRDRAPVVALLARLGLQDRAAALPSALSGGEVARAGLAVALANDPPVLLADEPTGELDRQTEEVVADLLSEQASEGRAVVVVTHSTVLAERADRILTLTDGIVSNPGSPTPGRPS